MSFKTMREKQILARAIEIQNEKEKENNIHCLCVLNLFSIIVMLGLPQPSVFSLDSNNP